MEVIREAVGAAGGEMSPVVFPEQDPGSLLFTYHGDVGKPGMKVPGFDEDEYAIACFNAGGAKGLAAARIMSNRFPHIPGVADKTRTIGVFSYELLGNGAIVSELLHTVDPNTLLSDEQVKAGDNIEDFRFMSYGKNQLVISATDADSHYIPRVVMGLATEDVDAQGNRQLDFDKIHMARNAKGELIEGKNGMPFKILPDGRVVVVYRPQKLDDGKDNANRFNFAVWDPKHPDEAFEELEDMEMPLVPGYIKYGWNGGNSENGIPYHGYVLHEIHGIKALPTTEGEDPDLQYDLMLGIFEDTGKGGLKCVGVITKPTFSYDDAQVVIKKTLSTESEPIQKLDVKKRVGYSPLTEVVDGVRFHSYTHDDTYWGFVSTEQEAVSQFADYHIAHGNIVYAPGFELNSRRYALSA